MSNRNFHIFQNIFFLSLIGTVCFVILRPYDALDHLFKKHYEVEEQRSGEYIKSLHSHLAYEMSERGQYEKVYPYYALSNHVDSATQQIIRYIDTVRRPLVADSLQNRIDWYTTELLTAIPHDSSFLSPFVFDIRHISGPSFDGGGWLSSLLRGQPLNKQELIILALRSNIYSAEKIVLKRLTELSHPACILRYDTTFVLTSCSTRIWNVGDTVTHSLALAIIMMYSGQVDFYGEGNLSPAERPAISHWSGIAQEPGDYTVKGFIKGEWNKGDRLHNIWDTLPWSFQYRVVAKGISLVHDANQVCYRQGANAISVAIPGYTPEQVKLRATGADFVNLGNGRWTFTITDKQCDKIIVYADATDKRGHTSAVHASLFPVRDMLPLSILIDEKTTNSLSVSEIMTPHVLSAVSGADDDIEKYDITHYHLCIISANGKLLGDYDLNSSLLDGNNEKIRRTFRTLTAGARLYITEAISKTKAGSLPAAAVAIVLQ